MEIFGIINIVTGEELIPFEEIVLRNIHAVTNPETEEREFFVEGNNQIVRPLTDYLEAILNRQ